MLEWFFGRADNVSAPRPAYLCSWSHSRVYTPLIFPACGYAFGGIELRAETIDLNTMKWNPFAFGALTFPQRHIIYFWTIGGALLLSRPGKASAVDIAPLSPMTRPAAAYTEPTLLFGPPSRSRASGLRVAKQAKHPRYPIVPKAI